MTDKKESIRQILIEAFQRIADEHGVIVEHVKAEWVMYTKNGSTGGKVVTLEIEAIL